MNKYNFMVLLKKNEGIPVGFEIIDIEIVPLDGASLVTLDCVFSCYVFFNL